MSTYHLGSRHRHRALSPRLLSSPVRLAEQEVLCGGCSEALGGGGGVRRGSEPLSGAGNTLPQLHGFGEDGVQLKPEGAGP